MKSLYAASILAYTHVSQLKGYLWTMVSMNMLHSLNWRAVADSVDSKRLLMTGGLIVLLHRQIRAGQMAVARKAPFSGILTV